MNSIRARSEWLAHLRYCTRCPTDLCDRGEELAAAVRETMAPEETWAGVWAPKEDRMSIMVRTRARTMWSQLGPEFRRIRHEKGLRLCDVQAISHVSHSYLSQVERGLCEPSSEVVLALCDAYGIVIRVSLHQRNMQLDA